MEAELPEVVFGMVSVPNDETAERIAKSLVEHQLAACIQAFPIKSTYIWEGALNVDSEVLLLIKTRASLAEAVREHVVSIHPYDVAEVLFTPITSGNTPYISWLASLTKAG